MLQLITTTGARPDAWRLCRLWVSRQDYAGPVLWIVVDDGAQPMQQARSSAGWRIEHLYPKPSWRPGWNTQMRNLRAAIARADLSKPIVIIEDDDYYGPGYLSAIAENLERADLVGHGLSRKYNLLTRRAKEQFYPTKASLCCTAFKGVATQQFIALLRQSPRFIDMPLWAQSRNRLVFRGEHVVSMKCMPGRKGIDSGHQLRFGEMADPRGLLLRQWIGDDAEHYEDLMSNAADTVRANEIAQYVEAYKHADYRMGVRRKRDVERILADTPPGSLLDIGTGRGETLAMAERLGYGPVMGTEVVPYLLKAGRVVRAEAHKLPFEDAQFDNVTCFDVLEHLTEQDLRPALREMHRVAKHRVIVSASELPSIYRGRDLHISRRPKAQWLSLIKECWGDGAVAFGMAGASPAFMVVKA